MSPLMGRVCVCVFLTSLNRNGRLNVIKQIILYVRCIRSKVMVEMFL